MISRLMTVLLFTSRISRTVRILRSGLLRQWRTVSKNRLEAGLWASGLFAVAVADPHTSGLIETCVFKLIGIPRCPGCGLGHAIGFLVRGEILFSIQSHPLAILVAGILLHRIVKLVRSDSIRSFPSKPPSHYVESH